MHVRFVALECLKRATIRAGNVLNPKLLSNCLQESGIRDMSHLHRLFYSIRIIYNPGSCMPCVDARNAEPALAPQSNVSLAGGSEIIPRPTCHRRVTRDIATSRLTHFSLYRRTNFQCTKDHYTCQTQPRWCSSWKSVSYLHTATSARPLRPTAGMLFSEYIYQ